MLPDVGLRLPIGTNVYVRGMDLPFEDPGISRGTVVSYGYDDEVVLRMDPSARNHIPLCRLRVSSESVIPITVEAVL